MVRDHLDLKRMQSLVFSHYYWRTTVGLTPMCFFYVGHECCKRTRPPPHAVAYSFVYPTLFTE